MVAISANHQFHHKKKHTKGKHFVSINQVLDLLEKQKNATRLVEKRKLYNQILSLFMNSKNPEFFVVLA